MAGKGKRYWAEFKARVALEALRGELTVSRLATRHGVHQTLIGDWKRQAMDGLATVFSAPWGAWARGRAGAKEGMGDPEGAVLAGVEHAGCGVLRGGAGGGLGAVRPSRDLQLRPSGIAKRLARGSPFTSSALTGVLQQAGVRISTDGRGRWMDNVFIERLWRSLKHECISLHAFETGSELHAGLSRWISDHNARRPHSTLAGRTPDEAYEAGQMERLAA